MEDAAFNDRRTRKALDELADMLLTGPVQMPSPFVDHTKTGDRAPGRNGNGNGNGNGHGNGRNGSNPLRLHGENNAARNRRRALGPAALEGVMLGHLPGFAGPWVAQYADLTAHTPGAPGAASSASGGLALVRLAGDSVDLELYGDGDILTDYDRAAHERERPADLAAALAAVAEYASRYAVVIDGPDDADQRARLGELDRWTVLTAANDAAVVAAYRLLKRLMVDAKVPPPPRGVRLSFVGCEEHEAVAAAERIARASAAFLATTVRYAGCRKQMQPVRRVHVGRFDTGADHEDPWAVLLAFFQPPAAVAGPREADDADALLTEAELAALAEFDDEAPPDLDAPPFVMPTLGAHAAPAPQPDAYDDDYADHAAVDPVDAYVREHDEDLDAGVEEEAPDEPIDLDPAHDVNDELEQRLIRSLDDDAPTPAPGSCAPGHGTPGAHGAPTDADADPVDEHDVPVDAEAAVDIETDVDTDDDAFDPITACPEQLAGFLDGARPLEARCPHQPDVQLAVDADGRVALLLAADAARTSNAIRCLLETRTWAAAHRTLIAMTDRRGSVNAAADPVCHLFTDQPRVALQLAFAGLTDTRPIQLHLLKPITLDGRPQYLHEPLS